MSVGGRAKNREGAMLVDAIGYYEKEPQDGIIDNSHYKFN
jgi:hypothetical protein